MSFVTKTWPVNTTSGIESNIRVSDSGNSICCIPDRMYKRNAGLPVAFEYPSAHVLPLVSCRVRNVFYVCQIVEHIVNADNDTPWIPKTEYRRLPLQAFAQKSLRLSSISLMIVVCFCRGH